jgi:hypothetical protein
MNLVNVILNLGIIKKLMNVLIGHSLRIKVENWLEALLPNLAF